mmetsp:Transcript_10553/g.14732  ORF Transcript_10553/g.14732 Transcript_10553/m.14732 type:complete len:272 (-) Transcript_10553:755-1570(-)
MAGRSSGGSFQVMVPLSASQSSTMFFCSVASMRARTPSSSKLGSPRAWFFTSCSWSSTSSSSMASSSRLAMSARMMEAASPRVTEGRTISLYFSKFSGVIISFSSSSLLDPSVFMSAIIMAYFSRACSTTSVSGISIFTCSISASSSARLRFWVSMSAFSWPTAALISSFSSAKVRPSRMEAANSSLGSGSVRTFTAEHLMAKMASLLARLPTEKRAGSVTTTSFSSPARMPSTPSYRPSVYRPGSSTTSTWSPEASSGRGSPREPSAARR